MLAKVAGPFDLDFPGRRQAVVRTDCSNRLVELLRPGGLLVTDNVLWDGEVVRGSSPSPAGPRDTQGDRRTMNGSTRIRG